MNIIQIFKACLVVRKRIKLGYENNYPLVLINVSENTKVFVNGNYAQALVDGAILKGKIVVRLPPGGNLLETLSPQNEIAAGTFEILEENAICTLNIE